MRGLVRAAGVLLLAVPFLPLELVLEPVSGMVAPPKATESALGLAIFGSLAWIAAALAGERIDRARVRLDAALERVDPTRLAAGAAAALAVVLLVVSWAVFRHRPLVVDSIVQVFQARIFASGALVGPLPPDLAHFGVLHMVRGADGWFAQYPPGHAALLAAGALVDAPWVAPVLLTVGSLVLLHRFALRVYGRATANLTAALLVLCPFFWFMGASFMNHVSTLFFVAAFLLAWARADDEGSAAWRAVAGAALGAAFLSRPLTALAIGVPFAAFAVADTRRAGSWRSVTAGALGFAAVGGILLLWNARTTGDPLLTGYVALWGESHGIGFHAAPWGGPHTPAAGLENQLVDLALLQAFLFEWPVPALLPVGVWLAAGAADDPWDHRLVAAFLALPAAYFFYWHRDAYLGPRYLYSGVAFLVPLTARALLAGARRLSTVELRPGPLRPRRLSAFATALVGLAFGYALAFGIPQRFAIYASSFESSKRDVLAEARAAGLEPGLVLVATSWGNRLLAELHALGVRAATAERAYRTTDHCALQGLVDRARAAGWEPSRTEAALARLETDPAQLVRAGLNGDPTLRLDPSRGLGPGCRAELLHDQAGYTVFVPHLNANRPTFDGPWVVARDLRERNDALLARFADRPAYRYRPGRFDVLRSPAGSTAGRRSAPP